MEASSRAAELPAPADATQDRVGLFVLLSAAFLVLQVANTDYGPEAEARGTAAFWFIVGAVLLWLVYRKRSRVARGVVVATSLAGAVIYALAAASEVAHATFLAAAFLGQALPLLSGPVRRHVQDARPE